MALPMDKCGDTLPPGTPGLAGRDTAFRSTCGSGLRGTRPRAVGGTGCPLGKTFFLHCQRRHPELPKIPTYLTNNLARDLAQERGCNNLLFHTVCARPRASLHALQSSSNVSDGVSLSLLLQHNALGDQLGQFSLKTSLKRPLLRQH